MNPLELALRTIDGALRTGQIGTPVAVRVVAQATADHGLLEHFSARLMDRAWQWFGSEPRDVTTMGGARKGEISTLVRFQQGQTALVSCGCRGAATPSLHIVLWGNRGTLLWEDATENPWPDENGATPALSDRANRLLLAVVESLRGGMTIRIDPKAAPAGDARIRSSRSARQAGEDSRATASPTRTLVPIKPPFGVLLVAGDHTHQPNYAAALAADQRCKLIALVDEADVPPRRKELNQQMARRLGIPWLEDLSSALRRDDVQVVSVCAEPERRGRIIVQAAAAGKHLYLDKPLAGTLHDAREIVAATAEAGVVSHMMSLVRSDAARRLREVVQSGTLGDLVSLHFDLCFAKGLAGTATLEHRRQESPHPRAYERADSKRELTNIGVYPLVMLQWLLDAKVQRVAATTGNYFFQEHQANDMEDFGQILLELDGGTVATVSAGRTGWYSHGLGGLNRAVLVGSKRTAVVDAHRPRATIWADAPPWSAPPRDPLDPMAMWSGPKREIYVPKPKQAWMTPPASTEATDVSYFLDCLAHGRPSDVSASLAASVTEILLAGYQSAATGSVVELPLTS